MKSSVLFFSFVLILSACSTSKKMVVNEPSFSSKYIELFHEGVRTKERKQYGNAISIFEACIAQNSKDDAAYYALYELYAETNQIEKSINALEKAAAIDPNNEFYLQELAMKYLLANKYKFAGDVYQNLLKKNPRNPDWLINYSECLLKTNKLKAAYETLEKLEGVLGQTPEIFIEKYKIKRYLHEDKQAEQILIDAIQVFPSENELLAQLIDFYFEKKKINVFNFFFPLQPKKKKKGFLVFHLRGGTTTKKK